ncbi:hypothetical protein C0991_009880, partial [Blastosporella zonata]
EDQDSNHPNAPSNHDSDNNDKDQQACKAFNRKISSGGDQTPSTDIDNEDNTNTSGSLLQACLCRDVKLTAAPAVNDFADPVVQSLLLAAIRKYEAHIVARHGFPALALQVSWATSAWNKAQNDRLEKLGDMDGPQYEFTDCMLRILKRRGSRICGKLLTATRSKVRTVFGFGWDKPTYIKTNAAKATALHNNNTFHFK